MQSSDELILLESDGVQGKYLCTKSNTILEAIGTVAVPRDNKVSKYRGTIIWSADIPLTVQVNASKKICGRYCEISDKDILDMAREKKNWTFGEFFCIDAANIMESARTYNINVEMVDVDSGEILII